MLLRIHERITIAADRTAVFDHTNRAESMVSFEGYGPIPGIRSARYTTPGAVAVGSVREVTKTDGSIHQEEIVAFERPALHTSRITGLRPPLSMLLRSLEDEWRFEATAEGTRIDRTFVARPRVAALPVALGLVPFLRRAVRRDLSNLKRSLEPAASP